MLRRRRLAGTLLVAATLVGAAAVWTVRGGEATAQEAGTPPDTVTLVTGDRVTLSGTDITVRRGVGRERVNFLVHRDRDRLTVVPTDAAAAVAAGRLDPRLFEVGRLQRADSGADLPVLLEKRAGAAEQRRVPSGDLGAFWRDIADNPAISKVRLDEPPPKEEPTGAETYELTIRYVDRGGRPAADYLSYVVGLDVDARESPFDPGGTVTVRLPRGSYQLGTFIPNGADDPAAGTMLVQPVLRLTGPRTVEMDARLGRPVSVSVPERDAVPVHTVIGYSATVKGVAVGGDLYAASPARMYTAQIGGDDPVEGFASLVATGWRRGASGDSPYGYHLAYYRRGRMWTGIDRHPTRQELATVRVHQAQTVPGSTGGVGGYYELPGLAWGWRQSMPGSSGPLPRVATEYYNTDAGVRWEVYTSEQLKENTVQWFFGAPRIYRSGRVYDESWNKAAFGPAFPPRPDPALWMTRTGDWMNLTPSWYGDAEGRGGYSDSRTSAITLYRDGKPLGAVQDREFADFEVPAEPGRYRLEITATRGEPSTLSTATGTTWTFDSAHTDGTTALPLSAIRFAPVLDEQNAAPAGRAFAVPVVVHAQPGSAAGAVAELTVEVSYDDGITWERADVRRDPQGGTAMLRHPAGPGYVSLRATAADTLGNTVTQIVVHAYRLRTAS